MALYFLVHTWQAQEWRELRDTVEASPGQATSIIGDTGPQGCGEKPLFLYKTLVLSTIYAIMASYLAEMHGRNITSWQG